MPAYKDEKTNKWYCKFYYKDWQGNRQQKKKASFNKKKEALEWERDFLEKQQGNPDMTFKALSELYLEDVDRRLKKTTVELYICTIRSRYIPYFGDMKINEISPQQVRKWQTTLIDEGLAISYIKQLTVRLTSIFFFAMKFYNLRDNPVKKIGTLKNTPRATLFWTKKEFDKFITVVGNPTHKIMFLILYYTGVRIGELLALTPEDIDLTANILTINKAHALINGKSVITTPKTPKANRVIALPKFLCSDIKTYIDTIYGIASTDGIFDYKVRHTINAALNKYIEISGVKKIRLHDFRHSHVSLLIELGFSPLIIADRLGHEDIATTLNVYSHLYPHKQNELVEALDKLNK